MPAFRLVKVFEFPWRKGLRNCPQFKKFSSFVDCRAGSLACSSALQLAYAPDHPALQGIMQAATSDLATLYASSLVSGVTNSAHLERRSRIVCSVLDPLVVVTEVWQRSAWEHVRLLSAPSRCPWCLAKKSTGAAIAASLQVVGDTLELVSQGQTSHVNMATPCCKLCFPRLQNYHSVAGFRPHLVLSAVIRGFRPFICKHWPPAMTCLVSMRDTLGYASHEPELRKWQLCGIAALVLRLRSWVQVLRPKVQASESIPFVWLQEVVAAVVFDVDVGPDDPLPETLSFAIRINGEAQGLS